MRLYNRSLEMGGDRVLSKYLKKDSVQELLKKITTDERFIQKDIPNRINEEKVNVREYPLYILLDAIMKYVIIIDDMQLFDKFLDQLERILKKVEVHNEIKSGVTKLLIKNVANKLGINNIENNENKKEIIEYVYDRYIVNGYFFYFFPSIYLNKVQENGITPDNWNIPYQEIEEIENILKTYGIHDIFSVNMEKKQQLEITDSFFMACFYATNCPIYLQELCMNLNRGRTPNKSFIKEAYFSKDYHQCINNIELTLKKKKVSLKDRQIIKNFFEKEWNQLKIKESVPIIALIKRKVIDKNYLYQIEQIMKNSSHTDLYTSISMILDIYNNKIELPKKVIPYKIEYIPNIKDYIKKEEETVVYTDSLNEMGNATIVALVGVLLITIGVVVTIMMLGR